MSALLHLRQARVVLSSMRPMMTRCSANTIKRGGQQVTGSGWRATPIAALSMRSFTSQPTKAKPMSKAGSTNSGSYGNENGRSYGPEEDPTKSYWYQARRALRLVGCVGISAVGIHQIMTTGTDVGAWANQLIAEGSDRQGIPRPKHSDMFLSSRESSSGIASMFPHNAVTLVIAINVGVFLLHRVAPPGWCYKNLVTSWEHLRTKQYHTLLTNAFSQQEPFHLLANLWGLYLFGTLIRNDIGDRDFLIFYCVCGVLASISSLLGSRYMGSVGLRRHAIQQALLGASGSVCGLLGLVAVLHPNHMYSLFLGLVPPMRAETLVPTIAGLDAAAMFYFLARNQLSSIGHVAHLSGIAFGYLFAHTYLRWFNPSARALLDSK